MCVFKTRTSHTDGTKGTKSTVYFCNETSYKEQQTYKNIKHKKERYSQTERFYNKTNKV